MRDLIVTENITADGVIEAVTDWFGPSGSEEARDTAEMARVQEQQREEADAVLLGRVTFEQFRGYWPKQTDDTTGITDYLNAVDKYVVSGTLTDPGWEGSTVLRGPLEQEVTRLKEQPGKAVVATGSVTLVQALARSGLVDEYRLFVYPVVLGRGRRLFDRATAVPPLRLVEARAFGSGVLLVRYRPH